MNKAWENLNQAIIDCQKCSRLRAYCQQVALVKRHAYRLQEYWAKPVPGFGDVHAKLLIVGLAPGAHGSNRTGRMFTGDRSGEFLYAALYRAGLCNQPGSSSRDDGLILDGVFITAVGRCAPPDNKPTPTEIQNCRPYLEAELNLLTSVRVVLALGKIAFDGILQTGLIGKVPARPVFSHGAVYQLGNYSLVASYHVSQQNTQTGRLTITMFDEILDQCQRLSV